jgi:hypothetical protein
MSLPAATKKISCWARSPRNFILLLQGVRLFALFAASQFPKTLAHSANVDR